MSRLAELFSFAGLAVGAHLAVWVWVGDGGAESSGDDGEAAVSLAAASGDVADLVATWTAPPELLQAAPEQANSPVVIPVVQPPQPVPDSTENIAPAMTQPALPQAPAADTAPPRPETPLPPPLPEVEQADPAPEEAPAPRASRRPVERPADLAAPAKPVRKAQPAPKAKPKPKQKQKQKQKTQTAKQAAKPAQSTKKAKPSGASGATGQQAKGKNGGQNAGEKKKDTGAAKLSKAQRQKLVSKWGAAIRNRVERRKRYPSGTRASGKAVVRITASPKGRLISAKLGRSSGDARLDRAALEAVRRAGVPKAPKGLTGNSYSFNLPIAFKK